MRASRLETVCRCLVAAASLAALDCCLPRVAPSSRSWGAVPLAARWLTPGAPKASTVTVEHGQDRSAYTLNVSNNGTVVIAGDSARARKWNQYASAATTTSDQTASLCLRKRRMIRVHWEL